MHIQILIFILIVVVVGFAVYTKKLKEHKGEYNPFAR